MRIAICLSGQPRTWKKCYPRWTELFAHQGEVDYFFHFWNYNTPPSFCLKFNNNQPFEDRVITEEETQDLIDTLRPKKYLLDCKKEVGYWNCNIPIDKRFGPWCIQQYYSRYYVSLLKQQYELEQDFKYDIVIWQRGDTYMMPGADLKLEKPEPNVVYTTHNTPLDKKSNVYRIGDIFYYSDSYTSDQLALFYKFLSFVPTDWVTTTSTPPPEVAFYFYMCSIGLQNISLIGKDFKVMRDEETLTLKGKLDGYETI